MSELKKALEIIATPGFGETADPKDARIAELTGLLREAYPTVNVAVWDAQERGDTITASEREHLAKKMRAALAAVGEKK